MEFDEIDVNEMERQRYKAIKKSGQYLELNILIGADDEEHDGKTGKMPVVTTCMHGCGHKEISTMYMTLGLIRNHFKEEYPLDCMMADIGMSAKYMGTVEKKIKRHDSDKED